MMNKFIMLCGIPGAGKSTYAEHLAKEEGYIIHASDKIRAEFGDINDQSRNEEVFRLLHKRVKDDLIAGKNVIYDACQVKRKDRVAFLREIKNIQCEKICTLIATPYEYCLAQNFARDRQVPENVLCRMYKNFQMPCTYEGFDKVIVHYEKEEWKNYYGDVMEYVKSLQGFSQDNYHHTLTLGDHMRAAGNLILHFNGRIYDDVAIAAFTHDIGKPDTKSFFNSKGEMDTDAHYYSHHNVGAYKSLFFQYPEYVNKEYIALLIELHMKPYLDWKQSDKVKAKDLKMFGEEVIKDVELIHEADIQAK